MKTLIISSILALSATASADQCEWVTPKAAVKAQKLLANHPKFIPFCEPCGDKVPGVPDVVKSTDLSTPEPGSRELVINGLGRDLAYIYVETSPARYENLARLAGCPAEDVSPSLTVSDETKNGVLIVPTQTAVAPVVEVVPQEVLATPPSPLPAPPPQIVFIRQPPVLPMLAIILSAVAGCGVGLAGLLMFASARRRKRAMQPRAVNLPQA